MDSHNNEKTGDIAFSIVEGNSKKLIFTLDEPYVR